MAWRRSPEGSLCPCEAHPGGSASARLCHMCHHSRVGNHPSPLTNIITVNPQIVAGAFIYFTCIWGRLVLGAGLYFLRLFRMFKKVPLI